LLKLFAWEPALIDIKFKNAELIEEIPIIIISNELIKEDNKEIQEAFNNRIQKITFYKENNRNIEIDYLDDINESIKKEEVNIIVYCNKIFFKIIRKYAKERKNNKNWLVKNYLTNVVKKIESK
jgi:phosphopantetheine adenylyltransferase